MPDIGNISTAIIVIILIAISLYTLRSYARTLTHGCCGANKDREKRVRVQDKNIAHYPYCVSICVEGMTCTHCKLRVENALNSEKGVWAEVNLKQNSAIVHMKEQIPTQELRLAVIRAGYRVRKIDILSHL